MLWTSLVVAAALTAAGPTKAGDKPQLIVLELTAASGVEKSTASALTEAVTAQVSKQGIFQVVSAQDITTLTGLERQKQMMGCSESTNCLAELAGAIGARFVLSGSLAKLGTAYQLSMQTLDSHKAQPLGRSVRVANELEALRAQLPWAVAEATATPMPPPPSRVVPYTLMGVGAAAILAGGFWGLNTLGRERELAQELKLGEQTPEVLAALPRYQEQESAISRDKTLALGGMIVGAGLIAAGLWLNPKDLASGGGGVAARVVPSGTGLALVGVWP